MPNIHLYVDEAKTACGLPIKGDKPGLSRDTGGVDCYACLFALVPQADATAYCDGGCPDCNEQPPAYLHGYADGKSKAHFEVRYRAADHDPRVCGCEPCITVRVVLARLNLWPHGLAATDDADHPDYPGYKVCHGCGWPDDCHFPDCVTDPYQKRRDVKPEDARLIDQWVAENATVMTPVSGCPENDDGEHIYALGANGVQCAACLQYLGKAA